MQTYQVISLVDITRSRPDRNSINRLEIGQQANFNSLLQAIGLRSNVEWQIDPKCDNGRLPDPFDGKAAYWTWNFTVERDWVFQKETDPVGLLLDDLHGVPVIDGLNNTVLLTPSAFQTRGKGMNIWVYKLT